MARTEEFFVRCRGKDGKDPGVLPDPVFLPAAVTRCEGRAEDGLGVILLHGAGGDLHGGHMDGTAEALAEGLRAPVFRVTMASPDLNYRLRAAHGLMLHAAEAEGVERFVLAGQSNGARVACELASQMVALVRADGASAADPHPKAGPPGMLIASLSETRPIAGVALFSYPLHAPGNPAETRAREVRGALAAARDARGGGAAAPFPVVFVRGDRDAFAREDAWEAFVAEMEREFAWRRSESVHVVKGGDHGLLVAKAAEKGTEEARGEAAAFVCARMMGAGKNARGGKRRREGGGGKAG